MRSLCMAAKGRVEPGAITELVETRIERLGLANALSGQMFRDRIAVCFRGLASRVKDEVR